MSDFRQGQLVAVRDANKKPWKLCVFVCVAPDGDLVVRRPDSESGFTMWPPQVVAAEEIWPSIFIDADREIIDSLQKERDRLHEAIGWLCERLQEIGDRNGSQECPPVPHGDCRIGNCAECWEQASLEAVKEGADGTSEESPALGR